MERFAVNTGNLQEQTNSNEHHEKRKKTTARNLNHEERSKTQKTTKTTETRNKITTFTKNQYRFELSNLRMALTLVH